MYIIYANIHIFFSQTIYARAILKCMYTNIYSLYYIFICNLFILWNCLSSMPPLPRGDLLQTETFGDLALDMMVMVVKVSQLCGESKGCRRKGNGFHVVVRCVRASKIIIFLCKMEWESAAKCKEEWVAQRRR